jgi:phage shock protein A
VGQTSQYYQRLLAKLNEQETSIEKLQRQVDELQGKYSTQRKELETYLAELNVG